MSYEKCAYCDRSFGSAKIDYTLRKTIDVKQEISCPTVVSTRFTTTTTYKETSVSVPICKECNKYRMKIIEIGEKTEAVGWISFFASAVIVWQLTNLVYWAFEEHIPKENAGVIKFFSIVVIAFLVTLLAIYLYESPKRKKIPKYLFGYAEFHPIVASLRSQGWYITSSNWQCPSCGVVASSTPSKCATCINLSLTSAQSQRKQVTNSILGWICVIGASCMFGIFPAILIGSLSWLFGWNDSGNSLHFIVPWVMTPVIACLVYARGVEAPENQFVINTFSQISGAYGKLVDISLFFLFIPGLFLCIGLYKLYEYREQEISNKTVTNLIKIGEQVNSKHFFSELEKDFKYLKMRDFQAGSNHKFKATRESSDKYVLDYSENNSRPSGAINYYLQEINTFSDIISICGKHIKDVEKIVVSIGYNEWELLIREKITKDPKTFADLIKHVKVSSDSR